MCNARVIQYRDIGGQCGAIDYNRLLCILLSWCTEHYLRHLTLSLHILSHILLENIRCSENYKIWWGRRCLKRGETFFWEGTAFYDRFWRTMNHSGSGKRQAKVLEENYWDCSVCTYRNTAEAFKCLMCDVRKGTSTRKPRINPQLVAQQVSSISIYIVPYFLHKRHKSF